MSRILLDHDPLTGMSEYFEYHEPTDTTVIHYEQDISGLLDQNKALAADDDRTRKGIKEGMVHYARVPSVIIMKWRTEHGIDFFNPNHKAGVFRLLNSPEYSYLKTTKINHRG